MAGHNLATLASNQFTPKLKADLQDTTARPREGVALGFKGRFPGEVIAALGARR